MKFDLPDLESEFRWRIATADDTTQLQRLIELAIDELLSAYLGPTETKAAHTLMGLDRQLIEDRTYFVVERDNVIVGSGGWSARATLFGGDHTAGRSAEALDPNSQPARVRAMYTHPGWTRRGIGRFLLALSEKHAFAGGFRRATLAATLSGVPLYSACGYKEVERFCEMTPHGIGVPLIRMEKTLKG